MSGTDLVLLVAAVGVVILFLRTLDCTPLLVLVLMALGLLPLTVGVSHPPAAADWATAGGVVVIWALCAAIDVSWLRRQWRL